MGWGKVGASLAGVFALCFSETAQDWSLCARNQVLFTHGSLLYDAHTGWPLYSSTEEVAIYPVLRLVQGCWYTRSQILCIRVLRRHRRGR